MKFGIDKIIGLFILLIIAGVVISIISDSKSGFDDRDRVTEYRNYSILNCLNTNTTLTCTGDSTYLSFTAMLNQSTTLPATNYTTFTDGKVCVTENRYNNTQLNASYSCVYDNSTVYSLFGEGSSVGFIVFAIMMLLAFIAVIRSKQK